jgi:hypothetical protein
MTHAVVDELNARGITDIELLSRNPEQEQQALRHGRGGS